MKEKIFKPHFNALLIFIACIICLNSKAQSINVSSGIGHSTFFDLKKNSSHHYANYGGGSHQFLKVEIDSYLPKMDFLSIHLKLERSTGSIETQDMLRGCGIFVPNMISEIELYRMSIGVLPINLQVYKDVRFRVGTELSKIFKSKMREKADFNKSPNDAVLFQNINSKQAIREFGAGLMIELQFGKFDIGKDLQLVPIYNLSVGILDEVKTVFHTRTLRQSLGLAFKWKLKPRVHI